MRPISFGQTTPEKFQILARALDERDTQLARYYATYLIMARHIDEAETDRRLDWYLDLDARLVRIPNPFPMLH